MHLSRRTVLTGLVSLGIAPLLRETAPTQATPSPAETLSPNSGAQVFRIGVPAKALTTDPAVTNDVETHRLARQVYQTLIGVDEETGETIPQLAQEWTLSEDGRELVLELASGVTFHDGTELSADVVVENFQRWGNADALLGSQLTNLGRLPFSVVFGGFLSEDACLLDSVESTEELQVTVTLRQPVTNLISALTHPAFSITSPTSWADFDKALGNGLPLIPLAGSGPYRWGATDGATIQLTAVDADHDVEVLSVPNLHERLYGLSTEQLDVFDAVSPMVLRELVQSGYQVLLRDPLAVLYLGINQAHPVLANLHVRQAVAHALYRTEMVDTLHLEGSYVAHQFNPPSLLERTDDVVTYNADVSRAADLLAVSGYDGEPIEFWYPTGAERVYMTQPQKLFAHLSGRLTAAGFNIVAKPIPWNDGTYMSSVLGQTTGRGLHLFGRNFFVRDAFYVLADLFEYPNKEFGWTNPAVTEALAAARTEEDPEVRIELLQRVETAISLDIPAVPLTFPITALASGHRVEFYPISPVLDEQFARVRLTN